MNVNAKKSLVDHIKNIDQGDGQDEKGVEVKGEAESPVGEAGALAGDDGDNEYGGIIILEDILKIYDISTEDGVEIGEGLEVDGVEGNDEDGVEIGERLGVDGVEGKVEGGGEGGVGVGRKFGGAMRPYSQIVDPLTGLTYATNSETGRNILKKFIEQYKNSHF